MYDTTGRGTRLRRALIRALAAGPLVVGLAPLTSFGVAAVAASEQDHDARARSER